jgi:hypothetical protein
MDEQLGLRVRSVLLSRWRLCLVSVDRAQLRQRLDERL